MRKIMIKKKKKIEENKEKENTDIKKPQSSKQKTNPKMEKGGRKKG